MIDRLFKICNNWSSFHNDIESIKSSLIKNVYLSFLIDKVIEKYLNYKFSSNQSQLKDTSDVHYFKFTHIGNLLHHIKNKNFWNFAKSFIKKILTLTYFLLHSKLTIVFVIKTQFLWNLSLVYKFTCASYIGETCCHFKTKIEEHIKKDNKSHIFKHLHSTVTCFDLDNSLSFEIIDKANSKFDLKIKEALHINWRKPDLNTQQNHLTLTLSL